jgi:hypothetical protein
LCCLATPTRALLKKSVHDERQVVASRGLKCMFLDDDLGQRSQDKRNGRFEPEAGAVELRVEPAGVRAALAGVVEYVVGFETERKELLKWR